jgi:hypothetical protein
MVAKPLASIATVKVLEFALMGCLIDVKQTICAAISGLPAVCEEPAEKSVGL